MQAAKGPPAHGASRHDAVHRSHPAGPALRACSARQSSLRTQGRGPRRCQPTMRDAADAHGAAVPLERWRGTLGTVEARRRATEVVSCVAGLRRHPSAPRLPPTRGVAPTAARGQVFVRLRTLRATSLCVTFDRASARTLWWVEWHQRRVCSIESQILRAFENAADRATKLQPRTLSRAVLYVFKPIPYESCVFLLTVPGCFVYVTHLFL